MDIKKIKPYLNYVIENTPVEKFEFISSKGKKYHILFYKLCEHEPPIEFVYILELKNNIKYFYFVDNKSIIWGENNKLPKNIKHHANKIAKLLIFI